MNTLVKHFIQLKQNISWPGERLSACEIVRYSIELHEYIEVRCSSPSMAVKENETRTTDQEGSVLHANGLQFTRCVTCPRSLLLTQQWIVDDPDWIAVTCLYSCVSALYKSVLKRVHHWNVSLRSDIFSWHLLLKKRFCAFIAAIPFYVSFVQRT
jgi:hypothetical protein